jgi:uncharacterized membrane protein YebE (DUF533 family)
MNPFDILGSLMNGRMGPSAGRLERTFGNQGFGAPGGMFGGGPGGMPGGMPRGGPGGMHGGMPGGMPGGGPRGGPGGMFGGGPGGMPGGGPGAIFETLSKLARSMFGGGAPGAGGSGGFSPFDILSSIGKTVFGGSSGSGAGPGSAGWGANTVFGAIAAKALEMAKSAMSGGQGGGQSQTFDIDDATAVIAGLRKPANTREEQQVQDVARLTVRAMINAAKADGRIDDAETERLVGKLREDGVTDEEQRFVMEEMRKPMDLEGIVRAVPNQQVAAQIYTASLMAIEVDTDAEKRYMHDLARKLGLNQQVVAYLHQAVGLV